MAVHRPKGEPAKLKISDLEEQVIYILCPDKTCDLFFDDQYSYVPCRMHCPYKEKMNQFVVCGSCKDAVELGNSWTPWARVDHDCESLKKFGSSGVASTFIDGNSYQIMYERPTKD